MATLFQSLSQADKIEFFVQCQALMLNHHPDSPFIIKQSKLDKTLDMFEKNIRIYQGYAYADPNICVLWNKIFVTDPTNVNRVITENAYMPPKEKFNGVSIDFAVFRKMEDCFDFIKKNQEPEMKHILFIREGRPKIYPMEDILKTIKFP